jgi:hypothetical protein
MMTTLVIDFDLIIEACSLSCETFSWEIGVPSTMSVSVWGILREGHAVLAQIVSRRGLSQI